MKKKQASMSPDKYEAILEHLGLLRKRSHHDQAGLWLGINPRTSQAYMLGESPVPEPIAKLLRLCMKMDLTPKDVK